jgi:hypothetical protein
MLGHDETIFICRSATHTLMVDSNPFNQSQLARKGFDHAIMESKQASLVVVSPSFLRIPRPLLVGVKDTILDPIHESIY